jgi:hypothetical protein
MISARSWIHTLMPSVDPATRQAAVPGGIYFSFISISISVLLILLPVTVSAQNPEQTNLEIMQQISKLILDGSKQGAAGEFDAAQ